MVVAVVAVSVVFRITLDCCFCCVDDDDDGVVLLLVCGVFY